jgi:type I restriction enzyme S subunit
MKSNFERIGDHIRLVDERNRDESIKTLLGLTIEKVFIPSVANTIGSDMGNYKVIRRGQFACSLMQVRRDKRMPVALLDEIDEAIISQAYPVFEIKDSGRLDPEYLMMWFRRPEFDREACFHAVGGVRGSLEWEDFCNLRLTVPSPEKQREIVAEYETVVNRIALNEKLGRKLEETAQAIYKHWFVDFEFPMSAEDAKKLGKPELEGKPYKSSGGVMVIDETSLTEKPFGWYESTIGGYSRVRSGFAFKSEWWLESGVPVVKIGSIQNGTISPDNLSFVSEGNALFAKKCRVSEGDVVIAMTGATIGKIALIPDLDQEILINQRVGYFDLGAEPLSKAGYLYMILSQPSIISEILSVGGDSAQANVSPQQIENIALLSPTVDLIDSYNRKMRSVVRAMCLLCAENIKLRSFENLLLSAIAAE